MISLFRQPRQYQLSVRTLLVFPAVIAVAWWIAIQANWLCGEWVAAREHIGARASYHYSEMMRWRAEAQRLPPRTHITWVTGRDLVCRVIETPMTPAEIDRARPDIGLATRRANYHQALYQKYKSAMWLPFWPIEPDPPEPQ